MKHTYQVPFNGFPKVLIELNKEFIWSWSFIVLSKPFNGVFTLRSSSKAQTNRTSISSSLRSLVRWSRARAKRTCSFSVRSLSDFSGSIQGANNILKIGFPFSYIPHLFGLPTHVETYTMQSICYIPSLYRVTPFNCSGPKFHDMAIKPFSIEPIQFRFKLSMLGFQWMLRLSLLIYYPLF